nr:serine/threonine-protein phosphatase 4 regulatory subunit 3-like isoform X1 [Ipomoea batatas]
MDLMKEGSTSLRRLFDMEHTSLAAYLRDYSGSPVFKAIPLWGSDSDDEIHGDPWSSMKQEMGMGALAEDRFVDEKVVKIQRIRARKLSRKKSFRSLPRFGGRVWKVRGFRVFSSPEKRSHANARYRSLSVCSSRGRDGVAGWCSPPDCHGRHSASSTTPIPLSVAVTSEDLETEVRGCCFFLRSTSERATSAASFFDRLLLLSSSVCVKENSGLQSCGSKGNSMARTRWVKRLDYLESSWRKRTRVQCFYEANGEDLRRSSSPYKANATRVHVTVTSSGSLPQYTIITVEDWFNVATRRAYRTAAIGGCPLAVCVPRNTPRCR